MYNPNRFGYQTHLKVADHVAGGRNLGAVMAKGAEGRDLEGRGVRADAELHDFARRILNIVKVMCNYVLLSFPYLALPSLA
jgi:hypothetical protein